MNNFSELKLEYKPDKIQLLFLTESLPRREEEYFYSNGIRGQHLFINTMRVIFPDFEIKFFRAVSPDKRGIKEKYLSEFQKKGFYLIETVNETLIQIKQKHRIERIKENSDIKIAEIRELISTDVPIIIIKKTVFPIFYDSLKKLGYKTNNESIPYPTHGHQKKYRELLRKWLTRFDFINI